MKSKSNPEEQMVGRCFLQHSETMKAAYTEYCINHDKAEQLLEKYDQIQVRCAFILSRIVTFATQKIIGKLNILHLTRSKESNILMNQNFIALTWVLWLFFRDMIKGTIWPADEYSCPLLVMIKTFWIIMFKNSKKILFYKFVLFYYTRK